MTPDIAHQLTEMMTKVSGSTTHDVSYGFNSDGDRTSASDSVTGASTTYGYNQFDQLTSYSQGAASAQYSYNGDGLRMSKTVNGTSEAFNWDEAEGLPVIIGDGSTSYVTGPGALPLEQISSTGSVLYYLQDQLGSTRGLTDSSGATVGSFTYSAYGELTSSMGSASTPFGYAGQYKG